MPPMEFWMPPSTAGNDAPVGGLRATYAHATAHLRFVLPYHIPLMRLVDWPPYSLIREISAPNSAIAPAASSVCTQITPELSAGTCAPAQHIAMWHVSSACATGSVLRSAPGASSPQIVGFRPFAAAVRTHQRPRLPGEARPAAPRFVRRCAPVASGARGVWEVALERLSRKRDFTCGQFGALIGARCDDAAMTETDASSRSHTRVTARAPKKCRRTSHTL
jgi:hypothetical protein